MSSEDCSAASAGVLSFVARTDAGIKSSSDPALSQLWNSSPVDSVLSCRMAGDADAVSVYWTEVHN